MTNANKQKKKFYQVRLSTTTKCKNFGKYKHKTILSNDVLFMTDICNVFKVPIFANKIVAFITIS